MALRLAEPLVCCSRCPCAWLCTALLASSQAGLQLLFRVVGHLPARAAMHRSAPAQGQVSDKPRGRKPRRTPRWLSKAGSLWRLALRGRPDHAQRPCPLCDGSPAQRTTRPDAATSRTQLLPLVVAARVWARVCPPAIGWRLSSTVQMDHLATTPGGARMEVSRASNCTMAIARPQWRHTKVGGFASAWSGAASSAALAAAALVRTPSN
jgi:hypothetical protein